jgi:hypothetical protein
MTHICSQKESRQGKAYELIQFNFRTSWRSSKQTNPSKREEERRRRKRWREDRENVQGVSAAMLPTIVPLISHNEILIISMPLSTGQFRSGMCDSAVVWCVPQDMGSTLRKEPPVFCCSVMEWPSWQGVCCVVLFQKCIETFVKDRSS